MEGVEAMRMGDLRERPSRGEGGVRGVVRICEGRSGVQTVITDKVEAAEEEELASVSHASNSSEEGSMSIGN